MGEDIFQNGKPNGAVDQGRDDDSLAGDLDQGLEELRFEDEDDEGTIFKVNAEILLTYYIFIRLADFCECYYRVPVLEKLLIIYLLSVSYRKLLSTRANTVGSMIRHVW